MKSLNEILDDIEERFKAAKELEEKQHACIVEMTEWGRIYESRDKLILAAYAAGIAKRQIGERMGIGRDTVYRVIKRYTGK